MKNLFGFINSSQTKIKSFQVLNTDEMFKIRGGVEPLKPVSRPRDVYDDEEEG